MSKFNGGPAFPETDFSDEQPVGMISGMSLRDYFAAQICTALVAGIYATQNDMTRERVAELTYQIADAMIVERSKP